jgi:hypothetical protein
MCLFLKGKFSVMTKKEWLIIILLVIALVLVRAPFMKVSLERDEGEYAYCAWQMQQGNMPYRDIITGVSPGIFFMYRIALFIFGHTLMGIRLFTLLYIILTLFIFYYLARQLLGSQWAWLAGVIFVFLSTDPGILANMSQRETFALLPLMISFILLRRELTRSQWYYNLGNGLAIAFTFMIKQTTVFHLFFILGVLFWCYIKNKDGKLFLKRLLWLNAGLGVGIGLVFLYFAVHRALPDFWYWNFTFPKILNQAIAAAYATPAHILASFWYKVRHNFRNIFFSQFPLGLLLLTSFFITLYKRTKDVALYWAWFLLLLLSTASGWHFREQYFQLLIVPQSLLIAWGIRYVYRLLAQSGRLAITSYSVLVMLLVLYPFAHMMKQFCFIGPVMISKKLYGPQVFPLAQPIGEYIASQTAPADKIFVLGSEQEIYFYSQRAGASPHITAYTLTYSYGRPLERQREVVESLWRNLPPYIVKINLAISMFDRPAIIENNIIFEEVYKLVREKYTLDGFGYICSKRDFLVLGRQQVQACTKTAQTLEEELACIIGYYKGYNPSVLIFRLKDREGY